MIRYALKCAKGHEFDSWFQSAAAFDTLSSAGHVSCPECGSTAVTKGLMAPRVATKEMNEPALSPTTEAEQKLSELRAKVEAECDYVGGDFAREARAMHDGDSPQRGIYGEAKPEEAISLLEDGVPIAPLPFRPTRKAN